MSLYNFFPKPGHVLICDFSRGFVAPEMLKSRPVVVISRKETHGRRLCTVVPLSSTCPTPMLDWHFPIDNRCLPGKFGADQMWAKCDMLYTVSFDRMDKMHTKTRSGRQYYTPKISADDLHGIMTGIKAYLMI